MLQLLQKCLNDLQNDLLHKLLNDFAPPFSPVPLSLFPNAQRIKSRRNMQNVNGLCAQAREEIEMRIVNT